MRTDHGNRELSHDNSLYFECTLQADTGAYNLLTWMGKTGWDIDWSAVKCPVLLMQSLQDRVFFDAAIVAELQASIPDVTRVDMPESGHMLPAETPDAFLKALDDWKV